MADQKDQHSDSPAEDPKFIPLPTQAMAEKSLPGSNKAPESKSEKDSKSSDSDKDWILEFPEEVCILEKLKRKAFYSALLAFKAETSTISNKRNQIIEKLMKEWDIHQEARVCYEDDIQQNLDSGTLRDAEDPKFIPLPTQTMAEKSLPGSNKAPESKSEKDYEYTDPWMDHNFERLANGKCTSDEEKRLFNKYGQEFSEEQARCPLDFYFPVGKKMNLEELKQEAYSQVLKAFVAESSAISDPRIMILKELKDECNMSHATHTAFENQLQTDTQVQQLRKAMEEVTAAEELKAQPFPQEDTVWQQQNPEILFTDEEEAIIRNSIDPKYHHLYFEDFDSVAEAQAPFPLKKRGSAEKTLPESNDSDDFFFPMDKKMNLDQLEKNAYYQVLKAFVGKSSKISDPRTMILKKLKDEWNISNATHTAFENQLRTDTQVQQLRKTSSGNGMEKATAAAEEDNAQPLKPSPASHGRGKDIVTAAKELKPRQVNKEDQPTRVRVRKEVERYDKIDFRSFPCQVCKRRFLSQSSLTAHINKKVCCGTDAEDVVPSWGSKKRRS